MTTAVSNYYTTQITHVGNGASLAANKISASTDISTALSSTNHNDWPKADIQLYFQHSSSLSSLSNQIALYRRDINFDSSAGDEGILDTSTAVFYKAKYMGAFIASHKSVTTASNTPYSQYAQLTDIPLARECEFYIENTSNATINAGWTLKVIPKTDAVN